MIIVWVLLAVFVLLTVYFLKGKAGWLISGYNTLPANQKAEYDEKQLCKWIAYTILIPLDLLFVLILIQRSQTYILTESAVFAAYIIVVVIYMNVKDIGKVK